MAKNHFEFPWPMNVTPHRSDPLAGRAINDIGLIGDMIEAALKAQGKVPRSDMVRDNGYLRAFHAINELGPHLFPLISQAEQKVIGTRTITRDEQSEHFTRASLYELHGVIDVLTEIEMSSAASENVIAHMIKENFDGISDKYEVVLDYKGSRRPKTTHDYWTQGAWQVQTYAWLRSKQVNSRKVIAGVLLYINELFPSEDDMLLLKEEIKKAETDVIPQLGSEDYYLINTWNKGSQIPTLSIEFRLRRAIRIVSVDEKSIISATNSFDDVVKKIETCVDSEAETGSLNGVWTPNGQEDSCETCDFRFFCPDVYPRDAGGKSKILKAPDAP